MSCPHMGSMAGIGGIDDPQYETESMRLRDAVDGGWPDDGIIPSLLEMLDFYQTAEPQALPKL